MSDRDLIDAAAHVTGEDTHEIQRRGFTLTGPEEFERACHDEAWGCAYSRVWRAYLDVIREAA